MTAEERVVKAIFALQIMMGNHKYDIPEIMHILKGKC